MITIAIVLALVAAAMHGTWNVLVKVSGDPRNTLTRATAAGAVLMTPPAFVAWLVAGRPGLSIEAAGLAALSALLELVYIFLLSAAYRRGEDGVYHAHTIQALTVTGAGISRNVAFWDLPLFASFGMPETLV